MRFLAISIFSLSLAIINYLLYSPQAQAVAMPGLVPSKESGVSNFAQGSLSQVTLVSAGSSWTYLDDGSNQGTAWRALVFDDSSWASGPAQLGYGDGDEATTLSFGSDANNKYITTYFRRVFTVTDTTTYTALSLKLLRDDGAVVYFNGNELFRSNMPAGPIEYQTLAATTVGGPDESTFFTFTINPSSLISGTNIIAVEIHQVDAASSDISFDLELIGETVFGACGITTVDFAAIGDYGYAGQPEADVANLVKSWNPDFIITLGDNNYDNGAASTIDANIGQYYHDFIGNYTGMYGPGAVSNNFYPALGNHDWGTRLGNPPVPQPYLDYFTLPGNERYYNFSRGPIEFFAIDSDSHEPDGRSSTSTQAIWLQNQLAASTAPWKLVYIHHPPYSSSAAHGSETIMQWPYHEWGATAVLAGHDHTYERLSIAGFPYFVNGLGGRSIYSFGAAIPGSLVRYNGDYGAMLVQANSTCINFQFITRIGTVIDSYTIINGGVQVFLPIVLN